MSVDSFKKSGTATWLSKMVTVTDQKIFVAVLYRIPKSAAKASNDRFFANYKKKVC